MDFDRTLQAIARLTTVMATLRSPGGCPWDAEQTPQTLKPFLLEETYEVLEAIDKGDPSAIRDELGDLLLQIVFQARIFEEQGDFDLADVACSISDKLVRRHPHVFNGKETDRDALDAQWETIKFGEKAGRGESTRALAGVPCHLPALARARKVSEKASRVGFDWNEADEVFAKVQEELAEFELARQSRDLRGMEEELGDLLFSIVNLGRFLGIDAEEALRQTVNRFIHRFEHIETTLAQQGRTLGDSSLDDLDFLWEEAKKLEAKNTNPE
jgi:MazG family protein